MLGDDPLDAEHAGAAVPSSLGGAAHLREASRAGGDHFGHQTVTDDRALADDHDTLRFVGLVVDPSGLTRRAMAQQVLRSWVCLKVRDP
jgi:hypothetical protein